jgi:hypothetical protein
MAETSYELWVASEASGKMERYTKVPFRTKAAAKAWVRRYLREDVTYSVRDTLEEGSKT